MLNDDVLTVMQSNYGIVLPSNMPLIVRLYQGTGASTPAAPMGNMGGGVILQLLTRSCMPCDLE